MEASLKEMFGEKLRVLRTNYGYHQKEMTSLFGMGQQSYSDLEMGRTNFTDKKISKICEIFGINFQQFLSIESASISSIKQNKKLSESTAIRLLKLNHEKELLEKKLRIVQLELELKQHKKQIILSANPLPIYVMI